MRLRALALLSCASWWFAAVPAAANTELIGAPVQFHGTVVSRPCNIEPQSADQLVEMGTVIVKTLYRYGHTTPVPFSIKLTDCKTTVFKSVSVTFSGTEDGELPGKLAINNGANGAAIALFDGAGKAIDLGTPADAVTLQDGPNALRFSAYVQARPSAIKDKTLTEGEFTSVANFVLAYQ
ncbi:fimbrial protein [Serratia bockelmannii]|uniref:fimbrial protein n=1 Tax=Serratia bockelmannii TaxID=2703793 RepID=UPI003C2E0A40